MKFITVLLAVGVVSCLKPVPTTTPAEVINLQPGEEYMSQQIVEDCNMDVVMDLVTTQCCPKACTTDGYDHRIHHACSQDIILKEHCNPVTVKLSAAVSVCTCDMPTDQCTPDE